MAQARTSKATTIAIGWRNRITIGPGFLFFSICFRGGAAETRYPVLVFIYVPLGLICLAAGVSGLASGRVQIDNERLTMTRVWRRKITVARADVADVVIRISRFGNRTTNGRNVDLILKDGRNQPIEIQISDRRGPDPRVEGLVERLRAWVAGEPGPW